VIPAPGDPAGQAAAAPEEALRGIQRVKPEVPITT
jgi:hypothetical protein